MINKLLDTKDYFAGRAETLGADFKALSDGMAAQRASLAGLEERIAGQDARFNDSLNSQRDFFTTAKEGLTKQLNTELAQVRKALYKTSKEQERTTLAEFKAEFKRLAGLEEELKSQRKVHDTGFNRMSKLVGELQEKISKALPEIGIAGSRLTELEGAYKELEGSLVEATDYHKTSDSVIKAELLKHLDLSMRGLRKEIEARRSDDAKAQLREFKQELTRLESLSQELTAFKSSQEKRVDELSGAITGLSGPLTDRRSLIQRVNELEDIGKASDKRLDAVEIRGVDRSKSTENRINLIEQSLSDLARSQAGLEKRVSSDNEQLQRALGQVMSGKKTLERDLASQRQRISGLIKELSGS
jgi:chromosome segregation ATPase